ncbi:hypothetical protein A1OE_1508 [Candidatus Endolissoclinum faulkneri L2]|uniref:Uncharacterized protein n=1 Tax=Candidatus Endolissoclinum faulkneri L2 TaxID=1193729 RepID=K7YQ36_9PROT|nr:DUF3035 domain-containing protein [Candidatus Endolissoclinum faulkneri]AFX99677.1 hypothetical protein A1OE_1508 [Candidatus Endolissoclinum faulkneri L2]
MKTQKNIKVKDNIIKQQYLARSPISAAAAISILSISLICLGGCTQLRDALGESKSSPDEFQVVSRPPLSLPPNYELHPPAPQESLFTNNIAERILYGSKFMSSLNNQKTAYSINEKKFRQQLGLEQAMPNIRRILDNDNTNYAYKMRHPIERLLFWKKIPNQEITINAFDEWQRLQKK